MHMYCNFYGWAMPQPSIIGKFKWLEESEESNVSSVPDDNEYVYIS